MHKELVSSYEAAHMLGLRSITWAERCLARQGYVAQLYRVGKLKIVKMWQKVQVQALSMLRAVLKHIRMVERDPMLDYIPGGRDINVTQTLLAHIAVPRIT